MRKCSLKRSKLRRFVKNLLPFIVISRFGKKRLELMASTLASEDYVKSNARQCPHCNAPIEKNDGCNKVRIRESDDESLSCSLRSVEMLYGKGRVRKWVMVGA